MNMKRYLKWYFIAPAALAGFAAFIAIGGWIVMLLWNWLLPPLFGFPTITFWQGLGILALCRILFGGFGLGRGRGGHHRRMSREERERFRERMREHSHAAPPESQEP